MGPDASGAREVAMDRKAIHGFMLRFMERVSGAALLGVVEVAERSGLLAALAGQGPLGEVDIVERTGLQPRYVREVVRALAAGEILRYDPSRETFELPDEVAACLADESSPYFLGAWPQALRLLLGAAPHVARACREGGGVSFAEFGPEWVEALDRTNSPGMRILLPRKWLPAMPDVVKRLEEGARVADVGCGSGTAVLTLGRSYPAATIVGYDLDATSIARARAGAETQGLSNVRFERASAETIPTDPPFDLVTAFDVVHDLARPREALHRFREALAPDGTLLLVEPAAGDTLEENLHPGGALFYSMSTLHCMTVSLAEGGEGLGAAYGPRRTEALCREAGFARFRRLPIENPFNAFYEVRP